MKSSKLAAAIAVIALLSTTAYAGETQSFSALQGVEAQALSSPEMSSVYGQAWTPVTLQAAIDAKLQPYPQLETRVDAAILNHQVLFNAIVNALNKRSGP